MVNISKTGKKMIIEDYVNSIDILVRFIETGDIIHTNYQSFKNGTVKSLYDKTIYNKGYIGAGIYKVTVSGEYTTQYRTWHSMMQRCYSEYHLKINPSYVGVTVCKEWHNFQNFAKWFDENYYEIGNDKLQLDKDILVKGNKIYSPETCVFVPSRINKLFLRNSGLRGKLPVGVYYNKKSGMYVAKYNNLKFCYIGRFNTPSEAFIGYKENKERLIKEIAEKYSNDIPLKLYKAMMEYIVEETD